MGIVLNPHALNLIEKPILSISTDLRQIALVIILTRAGLSLAQIGKRSKDAILPVQIAYFTGLRLGKLQDLLGRTLI